MSKETSQTQGPVGLKATLTYHDDRYEDLLHEMGMDEEDLLTEEMKSEASIAVLSSRVMAFKA